MRINARYKEYVRSREDDEGGVEEKASQRENEIEGKSTKDGGRKRKIEKKRCLPLNIIFLYIHGLK